MGIFSSLGLPPSFMAAWPLRSPLTGALIYRSTQKKKETTRSPVSLLTCLYIVKTVLSCFNHSDHYQFTCTLSNIFIVVEI